MANRVESTTIMHRSDWIQLVFVYSMWHIAVVTRSRDGVATRHVGIRGDGFAVWKMHEPSDGAVDFSLWQCGHYLPRRRFALGHRFARTSANLVDSQNHYTVVTSWPHRAASWSHRGGIVVVSWSYIQRGHDRHVIATWPLWYHCRFPHAPRYPCCRDFIHASLHGNQGDARIMLL